VRTTWDSKIPSEGTEQQLDRLARPSEVVDHRNENGGRRRARAHSKSYADVEPPVRVDHS
jgi:hypothetical protein